MICQQDLTGLGPENAQDRDRHPAQDNGGNHNTADKEHEEEDSACMPSSRLKISRR